jgi:hypothetical protein
VRFTRCVIIETYSWVSQHFFLWGWVIDVYAWRIDAFTITSITLVFTWKLFSCLLQASGKDGVPTDSTSSLSSLVDATSSSKGETDHGSVGEHGVYHPPTSCYNYYYPG